MISVIFPLLAALAFAVATTFVRKDLGKSNFVSAALSVSLIGNIIIWPFALFSTNLKTVNLLGILFFAAAGLLTQGITQLLYFKGIEAVGASVTASVYATYPIYSSLLAVLLLSEALSTGNWIGILCMFFGIILIQFGSSNSRSEPKKILKKGLLFPLFAALTDALGYIARKYGLNICNEPLLGVALGFLASLPLYICILVSSHTIRDSFSQKDFRLFWKAGISTSFAWIFVLYALSQERVSFVAPLMQAAEPLFVLLFAYVFLREHEYLSFRIVLSTLIIVVGVILVTAG